MHETDIDPILQALDSSGLKSDVSTTGSASFHATGQLNLNALCAQVRGFGPLPQPVDPATAKTLHTASTPALHGKREATLFDTRVRDTGEIAADALTLRWAEGAQEKLLAEVADALGLASVKAHLHNLLVYGPGQFFKPHQDTEKHPGMVATLVLAWPSAHIGGELRAQLGNDETRFATQHLQANAIRWFAFYADCRHEVLPVEDGWRVVFTFDLIVPAEAGVPSPPPSSKLLAAMRERFYPGGLASPKPWIFLLDHEYTEHGLRWPLLKGIDRERVTALRAAAEELNLTVHLALAKIHETWTAFSDSRHGSPEPDEMIEDDMVLDYWLDVSDQPLLRKELSVNPDEAASFTDTNETHLEDEEYEGYMGNYGETLDYWYRRAALVLQTQEAAESSRFVTEFDAALIDAVELARAGRCDELASRLLPVAELLRVRSRAPGSHLLAPYSELATALPDAQQAAALCANFDWTSFVPDDAPALARLAHHWGAPWLKALLHTWAQSHLDRYTRSGYWEFESPAVALWPQPLPAFIAAAQRAGLPSALINQLLDHCLAAQFASDTGQMKATPLTRRVQDSRRMHNLIDLAKAVLLLPKAPHLPKLLDQVRAQPVLYPLTQLRALLQVLPIGPGACVEVRALYHDVIQALQQALAKPQRADNDRSLDNVEWVCRCADCTPVINWATSPTETELLLPLAENRRAHIQHQLVAAASSLVTDTIRQGRPYKLQIRKPKDLPHRRKQERSAWADDLEALLSTKAE